MVALSKPIKAKISDVENQEAQRKVGGAKIRLREGEPLGAPEAQLQPIPVPPSSKRR